MGRTEFVIIPKEIQQKILMDFKYNLDNRIEVLSKKYGYSPYKINKLIEKKFNLKK